MRSGNLPAVRVSGTNSSTGKESEYQLKVNPHLRPSHMLADVTHISRSNSPGRAKVSRSIKNHLLQDSACFSNKTPVLTPTVCFVYGVNYALRFKTDASRCCTYSPSMHTRQILTNYTRSRVVFTRIMCHSSARSSQPVSPILHRQNPQLLLTTFLFATQDEEG